MNRRDDWITELHYKEFVKPKLQQDDFYWERWYNGHDRKLSQKKR